MTFVNLNTTTSTTRIPVLGTILGVVVGAVIVLLLLLLYGSYCYLFKLTHTYSPMYGTITVQYDANNKADFNVIVVVLANDDADSTIIIIVMIIINTITIKIYFDFHWRLSLYNTSGLLLCRVMYVEPALCPMPRPMSMVLLLFLPMVMLIQQ